MYARLLCFEGFQENSEPHFADKDVKLTLANYEYAKYSIRVERLKTSFRVAYSIFDQVAFAINEFWNLGIGETKADAKNVLKSPKYPKDNMALTALYWSECEFSEKFGETTEASEKGTWTLRNALEHKYVQVHEYEYSDKLQIMGDRFYHIS